VTRAPGLHRCFIPGDEVSTDPPYPLITLGPHLVLIHHPVRPSVPIHSASRASKCSRGIVAGSDGERWVSRLSLCRLTWSSDGLSQGADPMPKERCRLNVFITVGLLMCDVRPSQGAIDQETSAASGRKDPPGREVVWESRPHPPMLLLRPRTWSRWAAAGWRANLYRTVHHSRSRRARFGIGGSCPVG